MRVIGTISGRMQGGKPNTQNWPGSIAESNLKVGDCVYQKGFADDELWGVVEDILVKCVSVTPKVKITYAVVRWGRSGMCSTTRTSQLQRVTELQQLARLAKQREEAR